MGFTCSVAITERACTIHRKRDVSSVVSSEASLLTHACRGRGTGLDQSSKAVSKTVLFLCMYVQLSMCAYTFSRER